MQAPETIKLQGGALSLDFANSADWTEADEPIEDALVEPDSLVRWGARLGVLAGVAVGGGDDAIAAELAAARELRPALRAVLIAAARGDTPDPAASDLLMRTYADAAAAARLSPRDGAYVLEWPDGDPRKVRFAVTADAIALLADRNRLERIHVCPGRNCGWLFLDTSGRRRWCSMATCGSRAKMRAMYARRQLEQR
jgi:predicted RNA-binding Zn ribbon-like protein